MYFKDTERIALFIDGANLYATAKALGFDIDYKRMLSLFRSQAHVVQARYYTAETDKQDYSAVRTLADWLDYNGYTWVNKLRGPALPVGRIGIDIAVDVLRLAPSLDHVVLFTDDGDFGALVEAVHQMGRRVSVVSTALTEPARVDDRLRRQADQFIDLNDLQAAIRQLRLATRRRRLVADVTPPESTWPFRYVSPA